MNAPHFLKFRVEHAAIKLVAFTLKGSLSTRGPECIQNLQHTVVLLGHQQECLTVLRPTHGRIIFQVQIQLSKRGLF